MAMLLAAIQQVYGEVSLMLSHLKQVHINASKSGVMMPLLLMLHNHMLGPH